MPDVGNNEVDSGIKLPELKTLKNYQVSQDDHKLVDILLHSYDVDQRYKKLTGETAISDRKVWDPAEQEKAKRGVS